MLDGRGGLSDLCVGTRFSLKQHNSTVLQDIPINEYLLGKHKSADQTFTVSWVSANQIPTVSRQSTLIQKLITFLSFELGAKILHVYFSNMGQEKLWISILFLILLLEILEINIKSIYFLSIPSRVINQGFSQDSNTGYCFCCSFFCFFFDNFRGRGGGGKRKRSFSVVFFSFTFNSQFKLSDGFCPPVNWSIASHFLWFTIMNLIAIQWYGSLSAWNFSISLLVYLAVVLMIFLPDLLFSRAHIVRTLWGLEKVKSIL